MILLSQILTTSILATLAMTAFSYLFSYMVKGNHKEPQLLNYLLDKLPNNNSAICREHVYGWLIHFSIGFLFVAAFELLRFYFNISLSLVIGTIFGFIAGLIGISGWSIFFALHPNPPKNNKLLYFTQLIFAHIIFGITMVLALKSF